MQKQNVVIKYERQTRWFCLTMMRGIDLYMQLNINCFCLISKRGGGAIYLFFFFKWFFVSVFFHTHFSGFCTFSFKVPDYFLLKIYVQFISKQGQSVATPC